jgi:hypothetical protein
MRIKGFFIFFIFISMTWISRAQYSAVIYGKVTDSKKAPVELVTVSVYGMPQKTMTNAQGYYELLVPANKNILVFYTFVGYATDTLKLNLKPDEKKEFDQTLYPSTTTLPDLNVTENKNITNNLVKIDPLTVNVLPSGIGGVEAILKTLPGVTSNNELSSQYNVRGGNFDENLVYVNDIEVYRPFLVRSGQQEGLSFINSDLVSSIQFSAGGFDAKYGDKMSSVLDIQYKKPKGFAGSVSGSLLGYSGHLEGISKNTRMTYLIGIRQKSNQYLLKSLETKGDYKPSFTDVQTYLNYQVNEKLNFDFLGNYARNVYKVIPETRETDFGTINEALRLTIYFDGQEMDRFDTYFGAFSGNYNPEKNLNLKFITSAYQTNEQETFDIQGQYWLDQLEASMGEETFGSVAYNMGVGTFINHARNYLNASVINAEHKGTYILDNLVQYWGVHYQKEFIDDKISEWNMNDSSGYSLPYLADSVGYTDPIVQPYYSLGMQDVVRAHNTISSNRYSGYYQQKWIFENDSTAMSLTAGIRANYWDLNDQLLISPRATFSFKPNWEHSYIFRLSSGYYNQPPFYRELRDFNGNINYDVKAQTSIHFVLSAQHEFIAWGRPFKYITEAYYKILKNIIPYEIDNVRIRYYANNKAHGFATGIDMKVNGEFVKGIESWASLSIMKTMEDIEGDYYCTYLNKSGDTIIFGYTADNIIVDSIVHKPGFIRRPTDQRVTFALFFQDYLPKFPTYKMHLNFIFGTNIPYGPPDFKRYKDTLKGSPYLRVDVGFSKQLKSEQKELKPKNPFHYFKTIWLSLEVFNLLQVNNTISHIWIKDVYNRQYSVPNYLTPRQLNLKLIAQF